MISEGITGRSAWAWYRSRELRIQLLPSTLLGLMGMYLGIIVSLISGFYKKKNPHSEEQGFVDSLIKSLRRVAQIEGSYAAVTER